MRSLLRLPKAHLHLHLEGAMRPTTLAELAGVRCGQPLALGGFTSFEDFMSLYRVAARLVRCGPREILLRLVREVVEDAAGDGAVWIDPHVNPLTYEDDPDAALDVLDAVIDEDRRTAARLGIGFGVLVFARRNADPSEAVEVARLAAQRAGNGVVAFGLAGNEAQYPPEPFAEAFAIARDAGLISAPHAGELAGPASVRAALDVLGARRARRARCAPRSTCSVRDGSPTAYGQSRTRLSSPAWPRKARSWTSAPPPTSPSAS